MRWLEFFPEPAIVTRRLFWKECVKRFCCDTSIRSKRLPMKTLYVVYAVFFLMMQTGCSEYYGYQPPAPIFGEGASGRYDPYASDPYAGPEGSRGSEYEPVQTVPLPDEEDSIQSYSTPSDSFITNKPAFSPAVVALMAESDRNSQSGDLDSAVTVLERALRIDPRNPTLTYKLAVLRIKQEKPILAEDLAKKAALLADRDNEIKRKSWLLISSARNMRGNFEGAREAKAKADYFGNR